MDRTEFGKLLCKLMITKGFSNAELVEKFRKEDQTYAENSLKTKVSEWRKGYRPPTTAQIVLIGRIMELNPAQVTALQVLAATETELRKLPLEDANRISLLRLIAAYVAFTDPEREELAPIIRDALNRLDER